MNDITVRMPEYIIQERSRQEFYICRQKYPGRYFEIARTWNLHDAQLLIAALEVARGDDFWRPDADTKW